MAALKLTGELGRVEDLAARADHGAHDSGTAGGLLSLCVALLAPGRRAIATGPKRRLARALRPLRPSGILESRKGASAHRKYGRTGAAARGSFFLGCHSGRAAGLRSRLRGLPFTLARTRTDRIRSDRKSVTASVEFLDKTPTKKHRPRAQ